MPGTAKIGAIILRRLLSYSDKISGLTTQIERIKDGRLRPRIETSRVFSLALVMGLSRLGSLNAIEQARDSSFWRKRLGDELPSADTIGRVFGVISRDEIRQVLRSLYSKLKRNKALNPAAGNKYALILDGHEANCSYLRTCDKCLERVMLNYPRAFDLILADGLYARAGIIQIRAINDLSLQTAGKAMLGYRGF